MGKVGTRRQGNCSIAVEALSQKGLKSNEQRKIVMGSALASGGPEDPEVNTRITQDVRTSTSGQARSSVGRKQGVDLGLRGVWAVWCWPPFPRCLSCLVVCRRALWGKCALLWLLYAPVRWRRCASNVGVRPTLCCLCSWCFRLR